MRHKESQWLKDEQRSSSKVTDSHIEQLVLRELRLESAVRSKELCVFCSQGVVTLFGTVPDQGGRRAAERVVANAVPCVIGVINRITINAPIERIQASGRARELMRASP